jgi:hypothetical protein
MTTNYPELDQAARRLNFRKLVHNAPLPTRDAVLARGQATGYALPDDFIDWCCRFGAGSFDHMALIALPAGTSREPDFWFETVFAIGANSDWDPLVLLESTYASRLPDHLLPVGSDPGGNLLLLGVAERAGVYVWDHEHTELAAGDLERRSAELASRGVDVSTLDIDRLLLHWEREFAARVSNPTGHGNLYRVADSFAQACAKLRDGDA